ncbi:MAG: MFS transporter [Bacteroidales bacterium]|nr:MFS transporter [Bacteroidales bacterium]
MFSAKRLNSEEKRTFKLHIVYSIIDGILYGILALNEFILLKSMKGTDYQVGFLFIIPNIVLLFSIIFNEIIKRTKHKKNFLNVFAIITRLPLLFVLLFPNEISQIKIFHQYAFLTILLIYYFSNPIILPMINQFLKQKYTNNNFGQLYSYATSISKIAALFSTFLAGVILDINQFYFKELYILMALGGIISIYVLTRINYVDKIPVIKNTILQSVKNSIKRMKGVLLSKKPFLHYQMGFMLYGMAFLTTSGVISLFLNDALDLNYSSLAFYKNAYNTLNIMLLPFFGKLIGKIDPRNFGIITFSALAGFFLFLFITTIYDASFEIWKIKIYYSLIIAYIFYGVFSATMGLLWFIGSAYFAKNEEVADYQSIHLSLTGFRGMFAPLLGIYFYTLIDYGGVFIMGIGFLLMAIIILYRSIKKFTFEKGSEIK